MQEYKGTFNLASAAGQLVTTYDKMNPARTYRGGVIAVSPRRFLRMVTVTFSTAATQTFTVGICDVDGTNRVINSLALVAATDAFFEPDSPLVIGGNEHIQVDVTATGAPAVTGTITIFTDEA